MQPCQVFFYTGRYAKSLPYLQRSFELFDLKQHREHPMIYGQCTATVVLLHWGKSLLIMGKLREGTAYNAQSSRYAEAVEHVFSQAWAQSSQASNNVLLENIAECKRLSERLVAVCEKADIQNWLGQGLVWLGWAKVLEACAPDDKSASTSDKDTAIKSGLEKMHKGIEIWKKTGVTLMQPFYFTLLAQCQLQAAQYSESQQSIAVSIELMKATGECWCKPFTLLIAEEITLAQGECSVQQAQDRVKKILADNVAQQHWLWAFKAQRLLNRLYDAEQGKSSDEPWMVSMPQAIPEQHEDLSVHPLLAGN